MEQQTLGIFGRSSEGSSKSASLQSFLVSRCRVLLEGHGCPLYELKWKSLAMPLGLPISVLRASVLRTSGNASGGWPTVTARDSSRRYSGVALMQLAETGSLKKHGKDLSAVVEMVGWGTPTSRDHKDGTSIGNVPINGLLGRQVVGAGWPTPRATYRGARKAETIMDSARPRKSLSLQDAAGLAGWATPMTEYPHWRGMTEEQAARHARKTRLDCQATAAGFPTPLSGDSRGGKARPRDSSLRHSSSLPVSTEKRDPLSPEFCRWLIGFPRIWDGTAPAKRALTGHFEIAEPER